jgi:hypothetical protein
MNKFIFVILILILLVTSIGIIEYDNLKKVNSKATEELNQLAYIPFYQNEYGQIVCIETTYTKEQFDNKQRFFQAMNLPTYQRCN